MKLDGEIHFCGLLASITFIHEDNIFSVKFCTEQHVSYQDLQALGLSGHIESTTAFHRCKHLQKAGWLNHLCLGQTHLASFVAIQLVKSGQTVWEKSPVGMNVIWNDWYKYLFSLSIVSLGSPTTLGNEVSIFSRWTQGPLEIPRIWDQRAFLLTCSQGRSHGDLGSSP